MRNHSLQVSFDHTHKSLLVLLHLLQLVLSNKVANSFSTSVYLFSFKLHHTALKKRLHFISVREHDISVENAFPPVFGHRELIVSWAFILVVLILLYKEREAFFERKTLLLVLGLPMVRQLSDISSDSICLKAYPALLGLFCHHIVVRGFSYFRSILHVLQSRHMRFISVAAAHLFYE